MPKQSQRTLVTFPNPNPGRDYVIRHECPEYTAMCPVTGQPDFGTIVVHYVPDRRCIELKSLKLYLGSFRNEGHFFEQATNQILDDLVAATRPRSMTVVGRFNVRGGIASTVVASYQHGSGRRGLAGGTAAGRAGAAVVRRARAGERATRAPRRS